MSRPFAWLLTCSTLWLAVLSSAQTVRPEEIAFDFWARDTFFDGYRNRTATPAKWDIPAEANKARGGVPVNLRLAPHGNAIDLGDALRQYEISEPFMLLVGFWQEDGAQRRFTAFAAPRITPAQWAKLWAPVTYADLLRFDALLKDPAPPIEEIRRAALRMKNSPPFNQSIIQVNPRIDAMTRRLQCSIRFADFFQHLAPDVDSVPQTAPTLWGAAAPGPVQAPARN